MYKCAIIMASVFWQKIRFLLLFYYFIIPLESLSQVPFNSPS